MHEALSQLAPYPFEKLDALRAGVTPAALRAPIDLSIGEPRHPTPALITDALAAHLDGIARYPTTRGGAPLRAAVAEWLQTRFALPDGSVDPDRNVLPVCGTREALFAIAQLVVDRRRPRPTVLMPNPFYQIYEGAALLAGAEPWYVDCAPDSGLPDYDAVPEAVWARCQLAYVCSPGNPTGAVLDEAALARLMARAVRYGFVLAADECYSEIYFDEAAPPPGLLGVAAACGNSGFRQCVVFHSLSKRSNAPGLRSGFVAGDGAILADFLRYRTYQGCAMSLPVQAASRAAWRDETHVRANRTLYREKFDAVLEILAPVLPLARPAGGFYLWPQVPGDEVAFARALIERENVRVLPGSFLGRDAGRGNPGAGRVRMALVGDQDECIEAAWRIRRHLETA